jgi:hypothetical protein
MLGSGDLTDGTSRVARQEQIDRLPATTRPARVGRSPSTSLYRVSRGCRRVLVRVY